MRIFEHPNLLGDWKCPICNTAEDKPVMLIGIVGTEEGFNMKAEQFHVDCLELRWNKQLGLIFDLTKRGEEEA